MIDRLPVDLLTDSGNHLPSDGAQPAVLGYCQWCGLTFETTQRYCPRCDALLLTYAFGESTSLEGTSPEPTTPTDCQWCDAPIPAHAIVCPACGADLPDLSLQSPGVNVPLSDEQLRELMPDADDRF